jgi:hypothetical protein
VTGFLLVGVFAVVVGVFIFANAPTSVQEIEGLISIGFGSVVFGLAASSARSGTCRRGCGVPTNDLTRRRRRARGQGVPKP